MSRHILVLLIGVLMPLQFSNAVPAPYQDLRDYFLVTTAQFLKVLLMETKHVFENIMEKAATIQPKSAELSEYLAKFDQFSVRIKELNEAELSPKTALTIFKFVNSLLQILTSYKHEDFPAELALEKNGMARFSAYYEESFQKFTHELIAHFDQYIDVLSSDDKKKEAELVNGFEKFKAEASTKGLRNIKVLFDLFDYEDLEKYV